MTKAQGAGNQAVVTSVTLAGPHWPSLWMLAALLVPRNSVIGHPGQVPAQDRAGRAALGCQPSYPSSPKKLVLESEDIISEGSQRVGGQRGAQGSTFRAC